MKPKKFKTMDGNEAAAYISYAFTEVAAIYPITPSSPMADHVDEWSANGKQNIFGQPVRLMELQSESGACGAMHGALETGSLAATYTASQGLLLMIPPMYRIAGSMLPGVMHVSARTVATHALSIFGDHSDVMACRQTGFAQIASASVQECMDLGAVSHLSAIRSGIPFQHFFEGFRTSHEIQKVEVLDYDDMSALVDWEAVKRFKNRALNSEHPTVRNTVQNPDTFFQHREACNSAYDAVPAVVEGYMDAINALTGRSYRLFNYYGAPDAERVVVAMGSVCGTLTEVIDYLAARGERVGMIQVHLYRPFSVKHFVSALPKSASIITVLDRTKEPGAIGEPLYEDVCSALMDSGSTGIRVLAGRFGLSSKDTTPAQMKAVFDNMAGERKNHFTVGIVDDVTRLSLEVGGVIGTADAATIECKFWGLGSDGTVGANKNSIKIIGDNTDQYVQAYFEYDSKKSGGVTKSHLRFGKNPIRSAYYVALADFVACHKQSYITAYDMVHELKPGGTFLLNTGWTAEELDRNLPNRVKRILARSHIRFYTIDAVSIAQELGLGARTNTVLQAAFFKLSGVLPVEDAVQYMKEAITHSYFKKGDKVLNMNYAAVDRGLTSLTEVDVPAAWADLPEGDAPAAPGASLPRYVRDILTPVNAQAGDKIPVSKFLDFADGVTDVETSRYEKRGIAVNVPAWLPDSCIGCNQCALVCPHAAIRPFLFTPEEAEKSGMAVKKAAGRGFENYAFRIQVDPLDCQGCGSCANVCPAKTPALAMKPLESQMHEQANWDRCLALSEKETPMDRFTVRGSQFQRPLMEFSGACAGCGETPYMKLMTQLFGDRMYIAGATGCTQAMFLSVPAIPLARDSAGHGPALANSLFENNAEYSLGMCLSVEQQRRQLKSHAQAVAESTGDETLKAAVAAWLRDGDDGGLTRRLSDEVIAALGATEDAGPDVLFLKNNADQLVKKTMWMYGGDGWAYDIGFGGLDHVLASNLDVNILVVDNELYANTGGQASKATPLGAVAQFAAGGKSTPKKDLAMIAMSYGHVYVAQVSMGADPGHVVRALKEAEAHKGPSLVIAYAPCINHGIVSSMSMTQAEQRKAVDCGYWPLFRYNPALAAQGSNPFQLDSKAPNGRLREFMLGEVRFSALTRTFPEIAEKLFAEAEEHCARRYAKYQSMAQNG